MPRYWLMKSEPSTYSIDDLQSEGKTHWEGVRNYQARNFMRQMEVGDKVLFYHSNAKPSGVYGLAEVCKKSYPDHTQFDPRSSYHDPKATAEKPIWEMVDVAFVEKFLHPISLQALKSEEALFDMKVVQPFQRLSVMDITQKHYDKVVALSKK